jgi:hypothetical protein
MGAPSRQLCKAMAHAYGSLHGVRPDGIRSAADMQRALDALAKHADLRALDLSFVGRFITAGGIAQLARNCTTLQQLTARRCPCLSSAPALALFPHLTSLQLSGCGPIVTGGLLP